VEKVGKHGRDDTTVFKHILSHKYDGKMNVVYWSFLWYRSYLVSLLSAILISYISSKRQDTIVVISIVNILF